jgi:voltage-gated potassium channel
VSAPEVTALRRIGRRLREERKQFRVIVDAFDVPMAVLGIVWIPVFFLGILVALPPVWTGVLAVFETVIWLAYIVEYLVKFGFAPRRDQFFKRNLLTFVVVFLPLVVLPFTI